MEKKIGKTHDISGLATTTVLNIKIGKVENKVPDTIGLVTTTILNTKTEEVKSKIPDFSDSVKKIDCNAKISDIQKKYFTTSGYNEFTSEIFEANIKEKKLVDKSNISNLVKKSNLNT